MNQFDDKYRLGPRLKTSCELNGEHHGDPVDGVASDKCTAITRWTCCEEIEVLGELIDCDTCLEPGVTPKGEPMPPGWVEDTNGHHCPKCQPGGTE